MCMCVYKILLLMFMLLVSDSGYEYDHKILTLLDFVASFSCSYLYMCVGRGGFQNFDVCTN